MGAQLLQHRLRSSLFFWRHRNFLRIQSWHWCYVWLDQTWVKIRRTITVLVVCLSLDGIISVLSLFHNGSQLRLNAWDYRTSHILFLPLKLVLPLSVLVRVLHAFNFRTYLEVESRPLRSLGRDSKILLLRYTLIKRRHLV